VAGVPLGSAPAVVHELSKPASSGDDVVLLVEAVLFVPPFARDAREDLVRGHAAVDPYRVHHDLDSEFLADLLHPLQELRRNDEVHGDDLAGFPQVAAGVHLDRFGQAPTRGSHRVREDDDAAIDRTTDLLAVHSRAFHLVTGTGDPRHHQVILANDLGVEGGIERVVADLARQHASSSDVNDHHRRAAVDHLPTEDSSGGFVDHPSGALHPHPRELGVDHHSHQRGVELRRELVDLRLERVGRAERRELGGEERILQDVDPRPVAVVDFTQSVIHVSPSWGKGISRHPIAKGHRPHPAESLRTIV